MFRPFNCLDLFLQKKDTAYVRYLLYKAEAVGIEPTSMVLETTVLPLNYASVSVLSELTKMIIAQGMGELQVLSEKISLR